MQASYVARIREDSMVGDKILQVQANDLDSGENGHVRYGIVRGDRLQQFSIEPNTGYVSVAAALDRESISSYVLEIEALDNGVPTHSTYTLLNIEISDANGKLNFEIFLNCSNSEIFFFFSGRS